MSLKTLILKQSTVASFILEQTQNFLYITKQKTTHNLKLRYEPKKILKISGKKNISPLTFITYSN